MNFNKLAKQIYKQNKEIGWWDDPNRCIYQTLQLVSTKIAEATEAERKNLMDDKLKHRKGGEVELADALIRVLDLGGRYKWTYRSKLDAGMEISSCWEMINKCDSIGGKHLGINMALSSLVFVILRYSNDSSMIKMYYSMLINAIVKVAELQLYDIEGALIEKLEFNKTRSDHTREERAKKHGKDF
jgi:hypothetical protein